MLRPLWCLAFTLPLLAMPVRAEELPTFSLRELSVQAPNIVLAVPLDPLTPTRFKVAEVLRGREIRPGDLLAPDLSGHNLQVNEEASSPGQKPRKRRIAQALLFLSRNAGSRDKPSFHVVLSGLRFWTEEKELLVPEQIRNPGDYSLTVWHPTDWSAWARWVRADVAEVEHVLILKNLAPGDRRNRALLDWVERHRHEFGGNFFAHGGVEPAGWGSLESEVYQWVLERGRPEDCWAAVRLYAELNEKGVPNLPVPCFGRRAGRSLLLDVVLADRALEGDRVRALTLLGDFNTLWPFSSVSGRPVERLGEQEQVDLLENLTPLLKAGSAALRSAAARTLRNISHPNDGALQNRKTKRALPALVAAYRAEPPGPVHDELAEAVCMIGGPAHWQELTGNPSGLLVRLRDLEMRANQVFFWLSRSPPGALVTESPTLTLERLDAQGKVLEKKQMPLPVTQMPRPWAEGWDGSAYLLVQFSVEGMTPGTWRVGVWGTAGKDKVKWTAEPRTLVLEDPKKVENPAIRKIVR